MSDDITFCNKNYCPGHTDCLRWRYYQRYKKRPKKHILISMYTGDLQPDCPIFLRADKHS